MSASLAAMPQVPESLVIVTGLSGSGKSYVNKCLEDMGYFCVDNLPLELVEPLLDRVTAQRVGIINIKHLFGVSAVRASKSVELVIELQRWDPTKKYDRLGLDGETYSILDRERPLLRLPVASGRNLALLIEIAARNELLKTQGYDAAKEFARRVDEEIAKNAAEVEDARRT